MLTTLTKEVKKDKELVYNYAVIDGMNMSYKYYYGLKLLKSRSGIKTGLYHGFLSLIISLRVKYSNMKIIVAWEGSDLIRKKRMESYKANRAKKPDDFKRSVKRLKELLSLLGISQKFSPGYEADDIAAYYCMTGKKVLLVSEDSDWLQVMNRNCSIYKKRIEYNYEEMERTQGYPPERILLYKMIKGDSKDNIFGIPSFPVELAKSIVKNCRYLEEAYRFIPTDKKYLKWMITLQKCRTLLTDNYEILKLKSDIRLEDLPCLEKKNLTKLTKKLVDLQLYKVLFLLKKK